MRCGDVRGVVHPYLDGELDAEGRAAFEQHTATCADCRRALDFEASFKAQLRARLRHEPAPAALRERVIAALDQADGRALPLGRRVAPFAAVGLIAAAAVIFLSTATRPADAQAPIVTEAVRTHAKNLPVEVVGTAGVVGAWMQGKVPVPVRPPCLDRGPLPGALVGARLGHLGSRDSAQLVYRVNGANVTVFVFDASGLPMQAPRKRVVQSRELFVDGESGYNVVFFRDRDVGYAFTSELGEDDLVALVSEALQGE